MKRLIYFFLLFPSVCFAEPSSSINYLMNEPVTLFDLGIVKMEDHLKDFCKSTILDDPNYRMLGDDLTAVCSCYYKYDTNEIQLSILLTIPSQDTSLNTVKEYAKKIFYKLRRRFGIDPETGTNAVGNIHEWFSHQGYIKRPMPKNIETDIVKIINVTFMLNDKDYKIGLIAKGKLASTEVLFSK